MTPMRSLEIQTHLKEGGDQTSVTSRLRAEDAGLPSVHQWQLIFYLFPSCYSMVNLQPALLSSESVNGWEQLFEIHGSPQSHRRI